jgi:outer membrane lipoprotein
MKRILIIGIAAMLLAGCAPVLDKQFMQEGAREFQLSHLVETPEVFKDQLFIFGGVIVDTKLTEQGSQIEGLFVNVDCWGNLKDSEHYQGRFIALYPRSKGLLDPMIYQKGRQISVAADFVEVRKGKIDEMEYAYPAFEIRQIYLWDQYLDYPYYYWPGYYPHYYPYYYRSPYFYDPWMRPYPGPY